MLFGKGRQFFIIKHHMRPTLRGLRCNFIFPSICSAGFLFRDFSS